MKVIVVASQKGGAGKSTLTSHLAVQAEKAGAGPVAIIDVDPQGSLAAWWNVRAALTPLFMQPAPGGLQASLADLHAGGAALVLIDTPPAIGASIAGAVAFADLVVIPVRPSPNDLRSVPGTVQIVEACGKAMVFVINAVKPRVRMTGEAAIVLSQHGTVAPQTVADRALYASAMTDGHTAPEFDPDGDSGREMAALWDYIAGRLQGRGGHAEASAA